MTTTILIVEDEGMIALELKHRLERAGYRVQAIADNGDDAIRSVTSARPDLVLMDIRLRGPRDGIETADEIRRRFHVPVMFVTAHADRETLERAKITEPFGYIVKPFHGVDFRAQIEVAIWKQKMENKLRVSEAWLSATCHNVAEGLIATDSEGNIAFMNGPASHLTGWDWREAKGKPLLEVFQAFEEQTGFPMIHPLEAIYDRRKIAAEPRILKLRNRNGDEYAIVEARFSANRDQESLLGIILLFSDVTERRRAEQETRQGQKMDALAGMAAGLGRELERSQNKMNAALAQLTGNTALDDGVAALVNEVQRYAAQQRTMVQQVMRLGRTDVARSELVDVNLTIGDMQARLTKTIGIGRVLELKLEPGLPLICADPQELRETLIRLVANAKEAMPDGGTAEISTTTVWVEGRTSVLLTVRDSGRTFFAAAKDRVFDPYFQFRRGSGSSGIALALVYQFAASCGGSIEVSGGTGEGTAYLLHLPAAENAPSDERLLKASA